MTHQIEDFIGVFENALEPGYCESVINMFERMKELNAVTNRQENDKVQAMYKEGDLLFTGKESFKSPEEYEFAKSATDYFCRASWECYDLYAKKYGVLSSLGKHNFYDNIKVQKTLPAQGYHIWHCEADNRARGPRLMLVLAYLNDVEEGGETEFLYQSRRIKPKQGTIIICPSSFTHAHRGNPPLKGVKYVINGWIEFSS